MFTIEQIKAAHAKVKSGADFPRYVQELKTLGIKGYEHYVTDGHTQYSGDNGYSLNSAGAYQQVAIAATGSKEMLAHALSIHQQGQTSYPTFCQQAAEAGVEKWVNDFNKMTCTYYDLQGNSLIEEQIPEVNRK